MDAIISLRQAGGRSIRTPETWYETLSPAAPSLEIAGPHAALLKHFTAIQGELEQPPLNAHVVAIHLGGPKTGPKTGTSDPRQATLGRGCPIRGDDLDAGLGLTRTKLARALEELGRLIETRYPLRFIGDEAYRRRILVQLNRGEGRHQLARIVFTESAANCGSATVRVRRTNSGHSAWW